MSTYRQTDGGRGRTTQTNIGESNQLPVWRYWSKFVPAQGNCKRCAHVAIEAENKSKTQAEKDPYDNFPLDSLTKLKGNYILTIDSALGFEVYMRPFYCKIFMTRALQ